MTDNILRSHSQWIQTAWTSSFFGSHLHLGSQFPVYSSSFIDSFNILNCHYSHGTWVTNLMVPFLLYKTIFLECMISFLASVSFSVKILPFIGLASVKMLSFPSLQSWCDQGFKTQTRGVTHSPWVLAPCGTSTLVPKSPWNICNSYKLILQKIENVVLWF